MLKCWNTFECFPLCFHLLFSHSFSRSVTQRNHCNSNFISIYILFRTYAFFIYNWRFQVLFFLFSLFLYFGTIIKVQQTFQYNAKNFVHEQMLMSYLCRYYLNVNIKTNKHLIELQSHKIIHNLEWWMATTILIMCVLKIISLILCGLLIRMTQLLFKYPFKWHSQFIFFLFF